MNTITNELPESLDQFLMDFAQVTGRIGYQHIMLLGRKWPELDDETRVRIRGLADEVTDAGSENWEGGTGTEILCWALEDAVKDALSSEPAGIQDTAGQEPMAGRQWSVRTPEPGLERHSLKLGKSFRLDVDITVDAEGTALTAEAELVFVPMHQACCRRNVLYEHEHPDTRERRQKARAAAIHMARQWRCQVQRPVRKLKLILKNARP